MGGRLLPDPFLDAIDLVLIQRHVRVEHVSDMIHRHFLRHLARIGEGAETRQQDRAEDHVRTNVRLRNFDLLAQSTAGRGQIRERWTCGWVCGCVAVCGVCRLLMTVNIRIRCSTYTATQPHTHTHKYTHTHPP